MQVRTGWSSYHALQTAWTKRLSNRWQASATYTLSGMWDAEAPPLSGLNQVPFPTAPDLGGEFTLGVDRPAPPRGVQRHLAGRPRLPGERPVLHRHRRTGGNRVRRRPPRARRRRRRQALRRQRLRPGRHHRRRATSFTQPPRRRVDLRAAAADPAWRARGDRRHRRGVQRVQLTELDDHHGREQPAVRAAHRPARIGRCSSASG